MSDQERIQGYVEVWWQAVDDLTRLLEQVPENQWSSPTDLAGWDVHAVAAHVAHLEAVMSGADHDDVEIGEPPHVKGFMGTFTEQGVVARRDRSADSLIREIRESATRRHTQLLATPPTDLTAVADGFAAFVGWNWKTLLRNRPLDVWMHEQDVRRAVGRPGGMDSPAAVHTAEYLAETLGYVLAKRVGAPAGTTAVLELEGSGPFAFTVNDAGRGAPLAEVPADPTVTLRMSREAFIRLAGGRCEPVPGTVTIAGDDALGARIVGAMATTP